jgi:hypothetical protein
MDFGFRANSNLLEHFIFLFYADAIANCNSQQ